MAEHYLEFSETLTHLTNEETDWLRNQLETVHVVDGVEYTEDNMPDTGDTGDGAWIGCRAYRDMENYDPDFGEDAGFGYSFSEDVDKADDNRGQYLWIHSEENGCVDRVAHLVQKFLRQFRPGECWSLTYAGTCSKPRAGEFGGGAVFVTSTESKYFDAWGFIEEEQKRLRDGARVARHYVLFDHDTEDLATATVYTSYEEAAEDASRLDNVLVLALPFETDEPEEPAHDPAQAPTLPHAKQYVDAGGGFCPNCRSDQTEGDSVDFDGRYCTQRMWCLECDAVWFDVYTLSSVEPREE